MRGAWLTLIVVSLGACAPIDASSEVSVRPREGAVLALGEQRVSHEFTADYVQLGDRLLVELHELDACVATRHIPVLRVEQIERRSRGFVAWDFVLGTASGGFSALAFAEPQLFTKPLIDGTGRVVYDNSGAYVIGGVFAAISAGLLAAGVVNAVRARDSVTYADAFALDVSEPHPCAGGGERALGERELTLFVAEGVLEASARSDASGRARFLLPPWPAELPGGLVPASIEITRADAEGAESKLLELRLLAPFTARVDAHTGRADTRAPVSAPASVAAPGIEGPQP